MSRSDLHSVDPAVAGAKQVTAQVASMATCTTEFHRVLLLAFTTSTAESAARAGLRAVEPYLAAGPGWIAVAANADSAVAAQSLVQGVAQQLGGTIVAGSPTATGALSRAPEVPDG